MKRKRNLKIARYIAKLGAIWAPAVFAVVIPADAGAAKPLIRTTPEFFDFGHVPEGQRVFYRYWLANDGDDTLIVASVKPQCGCTTVPLPSDRLAPSDSVPLDLSFDTKNLKGMVNKAVRIWSNDSTKVPATIYFKASVNDPERSIEVTPAAASLTSIDKPEQVIELSNRSNVGYAVGFESPVPAFLNCQFSSDMLAPKGTITMRLTVGKGVPLGEYATSVTLRLEGDVPYMLTIPIRGVGYME